MRAPPSHEGAALSRGRRPLRRAPPSHGGAAPSRERRPLTGAPPSHGGAALMRGRRPPPLPVRRLGAALRLGGGEQDMVGPRGTMGLRVKGSRIYPIFIPQWPPRSAAWVQPAGRAELRSPLPPEGKLILVPPSHGGAALSGGALSWGRRPLMRAPPSDEGAAL